MQELWPVECSKDTYPGLDKFMCLACSPDQPKVTVTKDLGGSIGIKKYVRICESLLRDFYGNIDLTKPTDAFKKCGAWNSPDDVLMPNDTSNKNTSYTLDKSENPKLIFPNVAYADAEEFFKNFAQAGIPFMGDFEIQNVPDEDADGNPNMCYKNATTLSISASLTAAIILVSYLN